MTKQLQQLLDLPQNLNQKYLKGLWNNELDKFDSQNGIRCYTKTIYNWAALLIFISIEFTVIKGAIQYFQTDPAGGLTKVLSVIAILISLLAAFPIAQLIRSKGEALGSSHNGMIEFVFHDFVKTNIRLVGEVAALVGVFAAMGTTVSFITDHDLYMGMGGLSILDVLKPVATLPLEALHAILSALHLDVVSDFFKNLGNVHVNGTSTFGGDFQWNISDLIGVVGNYVNVLIGLVLMYVNLAIFTYLYQLIASLVKWIAAPSVPFSVKHKNV